jgi:2-hydroxychromene-2-carboxylate isomerase
MSIKSLIVYFDYKSPYAYLAKEDARALARDFGLPLEWRPYTLEIPDFLGAVETRNAHQWRRVRYSYMDARRIANERGLIVYGPKKIFNSRAAHIGALYAQDQGVFDAYHDQVFERFFKRDLDIEDPVALTGVLRYCGAANPEGFATFLTNDGADRYGQLLRQAEALGVFGVPMFVVGEELFWGGDRVEMVRRALARAASD